MLRYQNGYIAIIFLCMRHTFALKFYYNLFMLDIKVLINVVQFLSHKHVDNAAIINFKYYLLKSIFQYIEYYKVVWWGFFPMPILYFSVHLNSLLLCLFSHQSRR